MARVSITLAIVVLTSCAKPSPEATTSSAPSGSFALAASATATATTSTPTLDASAPIAWPSGAPPAASAIATPNASTTWTFDADAIDAAPAGFTFGRTGHGREGKWVVRASAADAGMSSVSKVLAQVDADPTDDRFPVAWVKELALRDVDARVRCKPISGKIDRACGLVFRLRDADDYYLTRANALEHNVRLYFVKNGRRVQIATHSGAVTAGAWHELRAVAVGDHLEVYWDGAKVIDKRDATFSEAGSVGVWTKADSVTELDDLSAKAP